MDIQSALERVRALARPQESLQEQQQMGVSKDILGRLNRVARALGEAGAPVGVELKQMRDELKRKGVPQEVLMQASPEEVKRVAKLTDGAPEIKNARFDKASGKIKYRTDYVPDRWGPKWSAEQREAGRPMAERSGQTVVIGAGDSIEIKSKGEDPDVVDTADELKAVIDRFKSAVAQHVGKAALFQHPDDEEMRGEGNRVRDVAKRMLGVTAESCTGGKLVEDDVIGANSPEELIANLRKAAQAFYESHGELSGAWQDKQAGAIWSFAARELERAADRIEKKWRGQIR